MCKCREFSNAVVHIGEVAEAGNLGNRRPAIGENKLTSWAYLAGGIFDGKKAHLFGQRGRVNNNLLMLSEKKSNNNSSTGEAVTGEDRSAAAREQQIEREIEALAELLLDIYEDKQKQKMSGSSPLQELDSDSAGRTI